LNFEVFLVGKVLSTHWWNPDLKGLKCPVFVEELSETIDEEFEIYCIVYLHLVWRLLFDILFCSSYVEFSSSISKEETQLYEGVFSVTSDVFLIDDCTLFWWDKFLLLSL